MQSSFIPNSNPAIGQTSTPSSARSKRPNSASGGSFGTFGLSTAVGPQTLRLFNAQSIFDLRLPIFNCPNACFSIKPQTSNIKLPKKAFSLQSAIPNPQSAIRRVKGAWWPSRSSKPLLTPHTRDQDRFDSYPLRQSKFDGGWVMFEVATTSNLQSTIKPQTSNLNLVVAAPLRRGVRYTATERRGYIKHQPSNLKNPRKVVRQMSREQIRRLTSLSSCAG